MKRSYWIAAVVAVVLALFAGWFAGRGLRPAADAQPADGAAAPRKILYYRNPMGLPDTSPVPKKDAMGMDYIPVYEGGEEPAAPGTVVLSPEKVQKLGVRTAQARLGNLSPSIRASATVRVDETRQYAIAPKFEGWVERLYADQTGMQVRRGQPLLSVYSPQLLAAQDEYRVADNAARELAANDPDSAATMRRLRDASRARLRNWDIDTTQLGHPGHGSGGNLVITSPANAVVVDKPIVQGARFAAGDTILRLADLSTVWLVADLPASSADQVALGQRASFQSPTLPGRTFEGRVSFLQPVIDPQTRTLEVRIELPNPDGLLRPGLFGDVVLTRDASADVLTVPRSAVLDSGTRQIVLVQVGEGRFEPRPVVLGERSGDRVEVREGLRAGERVVVSANFLIDAESNLQSALEGMGTAQARDTSNPGAEPPGTETQQMTPPASPSSEHQHEAVPAKTQRVTPPTDPDHTGHTGMAMPEPAADPNESHAGMAMPEPAAQTHAGHDPDAMER